MTSAGVFNALPHSQRVLYLTALIRALHGLAVEERFSTVASIRQLRLDASGLIDALTMLSAPLEAIGGKKRQRTSEAGASEEDKLEMAVADLTVLLESQDWAVLSGGADLAATLMGVLSALLSKRQVVKEGVDYLEQELLGAILSVLERITVSLSIPARAWAEHLAGRSVKISHRDRSCHQDHPIHF
jgi:U3 small nucleolar RNA-associated protein 10